MKLLLLLAALPGVLLAQGLDGTWQGTLKPAPDQAVRLAFKIVRDGDAFQGVYYNLDAGRQLNLGAVTLQGSVVKIAIPGMRGTYEGKLAKDANSIAGQLTQGANTLALELNRATAETAWELPAPPSAPKPLPAGAKLEFEVVSIKPSGAGAAPPAAPPLSVTATELRSPNASLAALITFTFQLHLNQVSGLPGWAGTQGYQIVAQLPQGGDPTDAQFRAMLQNLMRSRFGLAFHMEQRELPVYAIRTGKNGAAGIKLVPATNTGLNMESQGLGRVRVRGATMGDLADQLQMRVLDRPVIDQSGLAGRYDFTLDWRPDEFQFPAVPPARRDAAIAAADALPDLFGAFQEQLGLRLEAARASVPVLVIDSVSKPTEN